MHVLIYDPLHTGHHLDWVRLLVAACRRRDHRITFATTAIAAASPEFAQHLSTASNDFELDATVEPLEVGPEALEGFRIARRGWLGLAGAVRRHRPDHVIVPFGDNLVRAPFAVLPSELNLGLAPEAIDMIVLTGAFAYHRDLPWKRRLRSFVELLGLRRLPVGRLLFIDPIPHAWIGSHFTGLARRCVLCPDPVSPVPRHEKKAARAELGLPTDGRLISCVGVLDSRKGVDEFVRSFAVAPLNATDRLLLAGRAKPEVIAAIADAGRVIDPARILSLDRILSARELELAVSASDLVAVTYRFPAHLGSASILIRAVAAGRPVLSSELGWPGHVTRAHELGWIYPRQERDRPTAIASSLEKAVGYVPGKAAEEFAGFHSVEAFGELLTARLR